MLSLFRNFLMWCLSEQDVTTLSITQRLGAQYSRCLFVQVQLEEEKITVYSSLYSHRLFVCARTARVCVAHIVQFAVLTPSLCARTARVCVAHIVQFAVLTPSPCLCTYS